MLRTTDGSSRIDRKHLTNNEPVEQHPNRSQMEFDGWSAPLLHELLDVRGDNHRGDLRKCEAPVLTPLTELADRPAVDHTCTGITDMSSEELKKLLLRVGTG